MLRSDRLRTPDADDQDETELWEALRSEAHERHSTVDAVPRQSPEGEDFRSAFDSELPEDLIEDFMSSPHDTGRHSMQPPPPPRQSHVHAASAPADESEAVRLARYEALHAQLGDADYDDDELDEALLEDDDDEQEAYARQELAMEQIVSEQYDLQRFSQPPPFPQAVHYGEVRASRPTGSYGQRISTLPPAAYGHVAGGARSRARWIVPLVALAAVLGFGGAAGYQFVLLPRQEAARTAELAQQKAAAIALAEREQAEAAARDEAEQAAANEAAVRRADEAAAAAAGEPLAAPTTAKQASASDVRKDTASSDRERRRRERHEKRAAARAARHEARAARHASRGSSRHAERATSEERPSRRKKAHRTTVEENDDPLFGL